MVLYEAGTCTLIAEVAAKDPYPGASRIYQFSVGSDGTGGNGVDAEDPADGVTLRSLAAADGKPIAANAKFTVKNLTPAVCMVKTVDKVRRVFGIADGACNIQLRINKKRTIVINATVSTTEAGAVVSAGKPGA